MNILTYDVRKNNIQSPRTVIKNAVKEVLAGDKLPEDAVRLIASDQVEALLYNQLSARIEDISDRVIARGINASPGAATGKIFFDIERAINHHKNNELIILACIDLKPEDIDSVIFSKGWIISHSGATSHVAVVARQKGIPCVTGIRNIRIHENKRTGSIGDLEVSEGDLITIDGSTGIVITGYLDIVPPNNIDEEVELQQLLQWADDFRKLEVHANADTPEDANLAIKLGAEGIGVCRTEHMFLDDEVLPVVQRLILSYELGEYLTIPSEELEKLSIDILLPIQRDAFYQIFKIMLDKPVVIRLLDMSIDEFISNEEKLLQNVQVYFKDNIGKDQIRELVSRIHEANPMLGFRGSRLGILRPAIYEMQVRAIIEAACKVVIENSGNVKCVCPKIMIPLVSYSEELKLMKDLVDGIAKQVMIEQNCTVNYYLGTMIETPRAAVIANKLAEYAEFFSFGTNDLTQTTTAISRDDAENKFLLEYIKKGIINNNPFQVLDREGAGYLIKLATDSGRKIRKNIEVGICGEHGGDEESIRFCHEIGLDYVSCSPARVPVARLAAAHVALKIEKP